MALIGNLVIALKTETKAFRSGLDKATAGMKAFGQKMGGFAKSMAKHGRALSLYLTGPILAIGAAMTKTAMEAQESESMFSVSFQNMADAVRSWSKDMQKSLGVNPYGLRKSAAVLNTMLKSMEVTPGAAAKMSMALTELALDMSSFYDIRIEDAFTKIRAGITGETEPLKQLGIVVDEATKRSWAFKNGLIEEDRQLNRLEKTLAAYGVIMAKTTDAQGDLKRTLGSASNQAKIAKEQLAFLAAEVGEKLIPITTEFLKWINGLLESFTKWNDSMQMTVIKFAILAAAGPVIFGLEKIAVAVKALTTAMVALGVSSKTAMLALKPVLVLALPAMKLWDKVVRPLFRTANPGREFGYDYTKGGYAHADGALLTTQTGIGSRLEDIEYGRRGTIGLKGINEKYNEMMARKADEQTGLLKQIVDQNRSLVGGV